MPLMGTASRYGAFAVASHWISAAAVFALLLLGFLAANATDADRAATLLRLHAPLGAAVLAMTLARVGWWFVDRRPDDPAGQPRWQAFAAHGTHALLYGLLVVMGASGIGLLVLSNAAAVLFFGSSEPLPRFSDYAPLKVHEAGAFLLMGLLCVHVGAALHHQFVRRDRLLARMGLGSAERDGPAALQASDRPDFRT